MRTSSRLASCHGKADSARQTLIGFQILLLLTLGQQALAQTNVFPSSGNVGIGTTNPGNKLEVTGAGSNVGVGVLSGGESVYPVIGLGRTGYENYMAVSCGGGCWSPGSSPGDFVLRGENRNILFTTDAGSTTALYLKTNGNVGIGTTSPTRRLHIEGQDVALKLRNSGTGHSWILAADTVSSNDDKFSIYDESAGAARLLIDTNGNVGIGTTSPSAKLDVAGDVIVSGNISAKYQDLAEWVPSTQSLSSGSVVVLSPGQENSVVRSTAAYDTRVAGVVSANPGIILGEAGEGKVRVATTGRVKVRVDANAASIEVGDLLVTSSKEGMAMKSQPVSFGGVEMHRLGTLIGKALEPLNEGEGEILVLLSLQ